MRKKQNQLIANKANFGPKKKLIRSTELIKIEPSFEKVHEGDFLSFQMNWFVSEICNHPMHIVLAMRGFNGHVHLKQRNTW